MRKWLKILWNIILTLLKYKATEDKHKKTIKDKYQKGKDALNEQINIYEKKRDKIKEQIEIALAMEDASLVNLLDNKLRRIRSEIADLRTRIRKDFPD